VDKIQRARCVSRRRHTPPVSRRDTTVCEAERPLSNRQPSRIILQ